MKKYLPILLVLASTFSFPRSYAHGGISPTDLKTEWMVNPLGCRCPEAWTKLGLTSADREQCNSVFRYLCIFGS